MGDVSEIESQARKETKCRGGAGRGRAGGEAAKW